MLSRELELLHVNDKVEGDSEKQQPTQVASECDKYDFFKSSVSVPNSAEELRPSIGFLVITSTSHLKAGISQAMMLSWPGLVKSPDWVKLIVYKHELERVKSAANAELHPKHLNIEHGSLDIPDNGTWPLGVKGHVVQLFLRHKGIYLSSTRPIHGKADSMHLTSAADGISDT